MLHKVTIIKKQPMRWLCSKGNNTVAIINEQEEIETRQTKEDQKQNRLMILQHPRPSLFGALSCQTVFAFLYRHNWGKTSLMLIPI